MRQLYMRAWEIEFSTGDSGHVFSEKIDAGKVLHVHNCFAYAPERDQNDEMILGIRHGGQDIIIRAQAPAAVQKGLSALTDFYMGEGNQLYAYFPDAENGDTLGIHVVGEISPRTSWEKGIH